MGIESRCDTLRSAILTLQGPCVSVRPRRGPSAFSRAMEPLMAMESLKIRTSRRTEWIDITSSVQQAISRSGIRSGLCVLFVPHTTAAVTVNEGADPSVREDILQHLASAAPQRGPYAHREGNADAHIKAALIGSSVSLLVEEGRLVLGTWQSVFFCEFDGPRDRRVLLRVIECPSAAGRT
jgi:secondary thiamine-phosphate synthase enzyme